MLKYILKIQQKPFTINNLKFCILNSFKKVFNLFKMESNNQSIKSDDLEVPSKKIKLQNNINLRTVATMCGSWRPEETDGGLVLVFKSRDPGLSPDPKNECDFPENIEDFWVAGSPSSDDKVCFIYKLSIICFEII